jgi:hypothetical protein
MNERFIHIDSTYRNRFTFPDPCDFIVETLCKPTMLSNGTQRKLDPIINSIPHITGKIVAVDATGVNITLNDIDVDDKKVVAGFIDNYFFDDGKETPKKILEWNTATRIITLDTPTLIAAGGTYYIRKKLPLFTTLTGGGSTATNIVLTNSATISNTYDNMYLRIITDADNIETFEILSYNSTNLTVTLVSPLQNLPPLAGVLVEIHLNNNENFNPIIYNLDSTSNNQPSCHELQLLSLTVPNLHLITTGYNGNIEDYPYVIVTLSNINSGKSVNIFSNNINTYNSTFICPTSVGNDSTPWINLSCLMVQTLKFKLGDDLRFSIKLPNGEILKYGTDTFSPNPPNPFIQVSALFAIKKLN